MKLSSTVLRRSRNPIEAIQLRALQALNAACEEPEPDDGVSVARPVTSQVEQARRSPKAFRSLIEVEDGLVYEDNLDGWQREALDRLYPALEYAVGATNVEPEFRCIYRELPRGHSKTTDTAIAVLYALLKSPRLIRGYVIAADEEQGKLTVQAAERIMALNPWLESEIETTTTKIKNKITGAECTVVAANAGGAYGKEPAFVIMDEFTVWTKPDVFNAMFSAIPKRPRSALIITSNAGYGKGVSWQWKRREICRLSNRWWFQTFDGPQASWQSADAIEQQREELDPLEFDRLWMNRWLSGVSGGIPYAHIVRATRLAGPEAAASHGADFVLGSVDLGLVGDRATLIWGACYVPTRTVRILIHRTWYPKDFPDNEVELSVVGRAIKSDMVALGGADWVYLDQWQSASLRQEVEGVGASPIHYTPKAMAGMASSLVEMFQNDRVEIFHDERLESDLQLLRIVTGEHSQLRKVIAEHDEHGHADSAVALMQLLWKASQWFDDWSPEAAQGHSETEYDQVSL